MRAQLPFVSLCALALLCACDSSTPSTDAGPSSADAGPSAVDAGPVAASDAGPDAGPVATVDAGPLTGPTGGIAGDVTRTAMPRAGGVGDLYIAVFDRDPVLMRDSAVVVGRAIVEDADMSGSGAAIPYAVDGIPPRSEAYFVSAFLDDNMNAGTDPATAGPDRGDLVSLMGLGSPQVTVSSATTVDYDVVLNTNLPF